MPVRRGSVGLVLGFWGYFWFIFRNNSFNIIFKHVAFFFSFFILRIGVGRSLSPAGEESVS